MNDKPSRMDYRQHQAARRLVHECCNYDEGNCLLLDDGEPCVCVQSISLSLMCRWFRVAVLPLDGELAAALLYRGSRKRCAVCGAAFVPKSNRGKYCPDCAGRMKKLKAEIEQLISENDGLYNTYHEQKQRFKELQTVKRNIDQILRREEPHRRKEQSHER